MTIDMQQFHAVFFQESEEHLADLESKLLEFDLDAPDDEVVNAIFRAAHSIKGGSAIFGLEALTGLTHVMETLLDLARQKSLQLSIEIIDQLLESADTLKHIVHCYRQDKNIDWDKISHEISEIEKLIPADASKTESDNDDDSFGFFEQLARAQDEDNEEAFGFFTDDFELDEDTTVGKSNESIKNSLAESSDTDQPDAQPTSESKTSIENITDQDTAKKTNTTSSKSDSPEQTSIRVDVDKLNKLINLVGEIVITQSMLSVISNDSKAESDERLMTTVETLERNTRELQETVMSIRMLPISFVFNRFPRVVRLLSKQLGKQVELVINGGNTEIDKSLTEKLVDPLTHLIRNSIDHGIESPEQRADHCKPEKGIINLSAEQRGSNILVSITDDGAGLNRQKIIDKAIENKVIASDNLKIEDVWALIFEPGFSTATEVTDVSGRGVGMDVVKRNIESIGGTIEIKSTEGMGTQFDIVLPLTLAIVDGMTVRAGEQVYVIPLANIVESIQPSQSQLRQLGNQDLLWTRGCYWSIIVLSEYMDSEKYSGTTASTYQAKKNQTHSHHKQSNKSKINSEEALINNTQQLTKKVLVLVESRQKKFAIQVDMLLGQQHVVIKNLEDNYKKVSGISGATIMGDGDIALILDIENIAQVVEDFEHEQTLQESTTA
jgi:two-component system, chemotaxis family, sensor kinase CheA